MENSYMRVNYAFPPRGTLYRRGPWRTWVQKHTRAERFDQAELVSQERHAPAVRVAILLRDPRNRKLLEPNSRLCMLGVLFMGEKGDTGGPAA